MFYDDFIKYLLSSPTFVVVKQRFSAIKVKTTKVFVLIIYLY